MSGRPVLSGAVHLTVRLSVVALSTTGVPGASGRSVALVMWMVTSTAALV